MLLRLKNYILDIEQNYRSNDEYRKIVVKQESEKYKNVDLSMIKRENATFNIFRYSTYPEMPIGYSNLVFNEKIAPYFDISLLHLSINNLDIRGELCLSGPNTTHGYLDKSNDKDKLLSIDGRHLYRTGDFVKINLKDNKVYFLGRVDNQIKKMGIRIELEEIEAKIEENLFVERAMCIYNSKNKEIICFVESASKLEVDSLTDFIREKLPKYMIPDKFISVNKIQMNKNGKKDRLKALVDYMSGK
jgi:acyl-CoA synthetase (AMP-forming)/AMP-acid ligase II